MVYLGFALAIGLLSLSLFYFSLKLIFKAGWLLGFVRGCVGLVFLSCAFFAALGAYDVYSYRQIQAPQSIGTLSLRELAPQHYQAVLLVGDGTEQSFELYGDQWQLDARIVRWPNWWGLIHFKPGFRLDRISGRYYALKSERESPRSVHPLAESTVVDVWHLLQEYSQALSLVRTTYGSATYMPMVDNGLYEISLSGSGLLSRPMNNQARQAMERWQ